MAKKRLDIPVKFGNVSIGKGTARVSIGFDRKVCDLSLADEVFCGHRLTGSVLLGGNGDSPGQKSFTPPEQQIDGIFDVKQLGVTSDWISAGLTFSKKDSDLNILSEFASGSGRIVITKVAELPEDSPAHDEKDGESPPGSLKYDGDRMEAPLSHIFDGAILKALNKAKLKTVADLAKMTNDGAPLTTITGIGEGKAEQINSANPGILPRQPRGVAREPGLPGPHEPKTLARRAASERPDQDGMQRLRKVHRVPTDGEARTGQGRKAKRKTEVSEVSISVMINGKSFSATGKGKAEVDAAMTKFRQFIDGEVEKAAAGAMKAAKPRKRRARK